MTAPRGRRALLAGVLLLLLAAVGFVLLGNWQVRRLHWKLGLIHAVDTRIHATPVAAPGPAQWPRIQAGHLRYLHVRLAGHYLAHRQTLVRGTSTYGYGYWVMTPFKTTRGFIVLVNRGYVPPGLPGTPAFAKSAPPAGTRQVVGLLRLSEPGGGFLRPNRPAQDRWYSRDVAAIARARGLPAEAVAPYFIDAEATPGAPRWPAAGQTVVHFPNHHLQYAITWYLLALGSLIGIGLLWRHRRQASTGSGSGALGKTDPRP